MKRKSPDPYEEYVALCKFADNLTDALGARWISFLISERLYKNIIRSAKKSHKMVCRSFPFDNGDERSQIHIESGRDYCIVPDDGMSNYGSFAYCYRLSDDDLDESIRGGSALISGSTILWNPPKTISEVMAEKCVEH